MKLIILITLWLFHSCECLAQSGPLFNLIFNDNNNITFKIDTISDLDFKNSGSPIKWITPKVNVKADSIYKSLRNKYPYSFKDSSTCLIFNGIDDQIIICKGMTYENVKSFIQDSLIDYKMNYLILHRMYFEGEEYILFNPKNRFIRSVNGYPNFIDTNAVFAVSSFGGEYYFSFKSLVNKNFFEFYCDRWMIINYYNVKNEFYFEFMPSDKKESKKYIKLTLPNK